MSEIVTVKVGPVSRWFSYIQVYYASVQILVETLNHTKIRNATIDNLLADADKRTLLLGFRDDLLHGGSLLSEASQKFFAQLNDMDQWAYDLRVACDGMVTDFFARDDVKERMSRIKRG